MSPHGSFILLIREQEMTRSRAFWRLTVVPVFGVILSMVMGCGGGSVSPQLDPGAGVKQQDARYKAYGKTGVPGSNNAKLNTAPGSPKPGH